LCGAGGKKRRRGVRLGGRHAAGIVFDQRRILRLIVVVALKVPDVPFTVIVYVPVVALLLAVKVRTLVLVAGLVPNAAVTPEPMPVADRVTLPVKPLAG
jgi:hypothetical protein